MGKAMYIGFRLLLSKIGLLTCKNCMYTPYASISQMDKLVLKEKGIEINNNYLKTRIDCYVYKLQT